VVSAAADNRNSSEKAHERKKLQKNLLQVCSIKIRTRARKKSLLLAALRSLLPTSLRREQMKT